MHIHELQIENWMRLRAVRIIPGEGRIVDIVGRNGQGKTSVLEGIYAALAGASRIPSKPIHKGKKSASIVVKIGDADVALIVKRTFKETEDGRAVTSVTIENKDGAVYRSPQTMLNGLLDAISFDPLAFARMDAKEQLAELRKLVPDFDFEAIDNAIRGDYERRKDVNRRGRDIEGELGAIPQFGPDDFFSERVDESAILKELADAGEKTKEIEQERARRKDAIRKVREDQLRAEDLKNDADETQIEIEGLRKRILDLESERDSILNQRTAHDERAKKAQADLESLTPLAIEPDTREILARLEDVRAKNRAFDERAAVMRRANELVAKRDRLQEEADGLTASIARLEGEKAKAIQAANLPVEGLAFTPDGVLLNGLPFEQAAESEKLKASIAIIAARNPKLRVVRINDGEKLDVDGLRWLAKFAEEYDLQVWREVVQDGHKTGIVIEDGEIAP